MDVWVIAATPVERVAVCVDAQPGASTRAVVDAIAERVGASRGEAAFVPRLGRRLDLDAPWERSEVAHGDIIQLGMPYRDEAQGAVVDVEVAGGPDAGARWPLGVGEHVVGGTRNRAAGAVRVADDAISTHHAQLRVDETGTKISDTASTNGTYVNGSAISGPVDVGNDDLVEMGATTLRVQRPPAPAPESPVVRLGRIAFNRPPRLEAPWEPVEVAVPAPPANPSRRRFPLGAIVLPLLLGVVLFAVTKTPASLLFALLSPALGIWSVIDDRRTGRRSFSGESAEFRRRVDEAHAHLEVECRTEDVARRRQAPDLAVCAEYARLRTDGLWSRRSDDTDFLLVRIGSADQVPMTRAVIATGGSPALRSEAEAQLRLPVLRSAPVAVALARTGVVGVNGDPAVATRLLRSLALQLATHHSPADLMLAIVHDPEHADDWTFAKWIPHCHSRHRGIEGTLLASSETDVAALVTRLDRLVAQRRDGDRRSTILPAVVVIVEGTAINDRSLAAAMLDGVDVGVHVVWADRRRQDLPGASQVVVELDSLTLSMLGSDRQPLTDVVVDGVSPATADTWARNLAPLVDGSAREGAGVPDKLGLLELLAPDGLDPDAVVERWRSGGTGAALVGRSAGGPWSVDLDRDGPHILVSGMPGAGKSELLQSLIAALALDNPPERLTFLLMDFKGEAAFARVRHLPHVVGVVTDLDPALARRAQVSLEAEIRRRESALRAAGAPDLVSFVRSDPAGAPPRLVVVIDEFAVAARDVPGFVDRMVDLAQRGRSLGVHLVLSTQRPAGVVTDRIRANVNLRIALRVADAQESQDVLGTADAATIPSTTPGRAFVRAGATTPIPVQTAYGGTLAASAAAEGVPTVWPLGVHGVERATSAVRDDSTTDLDVLIDMISAAHRARGGPAPRAPWVPPLPAVVSLDSLPPSDAGARTAVIGLVDRPDLQIQVPLTVDFTTGGNVAVFGTARAGSTSALRAVAMTLAQVAPPSSVHIYGFDFGGHGLAPLGALPHCGGIVDGDDDERVRRLVKMLRGLAADRRRLLGETGASSFEELRANQGDDIARVIVLFDGYAAFHAAYERVDLGTLVDEVPRLAADGPSLGMHFVISADRRAGLPPKMAALVTQRIVLRLANPDEYSALGVPRDAIDPDIPGRAVTEDGHVAQIAVVGAQGSGADLNEAIRAIVARGDAASSAQPPPVRTLPTDVPNAQLPASSDAAHPVVGVGDEALEPVGLDLADGHALVAGPHGSGRSTALACLVASLRRVPDPPELVVLSPRRSPHLDYFSRHGRLVTGDAIEAAAAAMAEELELRPEHDGQPNLVVLVDDADELFDTPTSVALERVARRGRDRGIRVIAAVETRAALRAFGGLVPELRKHRQGLLLLPDPDVDGDLFGVRLPRRTGSAQTPGRGYLVRRGAFELVQVATP